MASVELRRRLGRSVLRGARGGSRLASLIPCKVTKNKDIYFSAGGIHVGSVSNCCVSNLGSNLATCQISIDNRQAT
jgi:hypothetical protein